MMKRASEEKAMILPGWKQHKATEEAANSPLTGGIGAGPARPSEPAAPDGVPFSPDAARLKSLNPLRAKSAPLQG